MLYDIINRSFIRKKDPKKSWIRKILKMTDEKRKVPTSVLGMLTYPAFVHHISSYISIIYHQNHIMSPCTALKGVEFLDNQQPTTTTTTRTKKKNNNKKKKNQQPTTTTTTTNSNQPPRIPARSRITRSKERQPPWSTNQENSHQNL